MEIDHETGKECILNDGIYTIFRNVYGVLTLCKALFWVLGIFGKIMLNASFYPNNEVFFIKCQDVASASLF